MSEANKTELFSPGPGKLGMTVLHDAAYRGDPEALEAALVAGLDPNTPDTYRGYTATHWLTDMAGIGGPRVEMLERLVRSGANIHATSNDGDTPLSLALEAGSDTGDELARLLVGWGAEA